MKHIEKYIGIAMLLFAVGFNLWLYRMEPSAQVDPNDNTFQFALVWRTNQIWDYANKTCSGNFLLRVPCHLSLLVDHWVPNWNEGYNLPFYYSHIPQILIVASHRLLSLFSIHIPLFTYYHYVIYLLLCVFPLSVFLALRVTGLPWITAGFGAMLASHISTDGLYGLDPPSFLWRGYGLSSQLFAMVWLPLAVAYSFRAFSNRRYSTPAIVFMILTTAGHLGVGIMAFLSLVPLSLCASVLAFFTQQPLREIIKPFKQNAVTLCAIAGIAIGFLSYWIVPAMSLDKYHNFSFWDPVWKFDSYGVKEIIVRLGNGALFDFGRLPVITGLILIGLFAAGAQSFTLLFLFFLLLYFGRTTWGDLLNIIPAMREFHQSRFIVGMHFAGLFLAPLGLSLIWESATGAAAKIILIPVKFIKILTLIIITVLIFPAVYGQTIRYAAHNDTLILQANGTSTKQADGANSLVATLQQMEQTASGRILAGRGGSWGKDFMIAETPMYMYLSNFALPTVLWLPETWSPNGDTEQYFREDKPEDYALYNIHYVATPANLAINNIQPFWRLLNETSFWKIYDVATSGYFTAGVRPAVVASDKYSFTNVIRLWIQSNDPKNGLYPELTFDTKNYPVNVGLPNFKMLDEVTFRVPDGSVHNVFAEPPRYLANLDKVGKVTITDERNDTDMSFRANVSVPQDCRECMVILKQTYHPNWKVTVDGTSTKPIIVFPFFIGIPVTAGTHQIMASYQPAPMKVLLLWIEFLALLSLLVWFFWKKLGIDKKAINIPH